MNRFVFLIPDEGGQPRGGIMNIVRHGALAASLGADVVIATDSGQDSHGRRWFRHSLPVIDWAHRVPDDVCVIPDLYSGRVNDIRGRCIVYMQTPRRLELDFDYQRADIEIWTDSPFMLAKCRERYPGKEIAMVPNIVDNEAFPFVSQSERKTGLIIVFPRKGETFIQSTFREYLRSGGKYWKPKVISRMRFDKMTRVFGRAQAFFASADVEGCALPPQESMAAGIVVVGKCAGGANFCMQHRKTAMIGESPDEVVQHLRDLENPELRREIVRNGHGYISRFFPDREPTTHWMKVLGDTGSL